VAAIDFRVVRKVSQRFCSSEKGTVRQGTKKDARVSDPSFSFLLDHNTMIGLTLSQNQQQPATASNTNLLQTSTITMTIITLKTIVVFVLLFNTVVGAHEEASGVTNKEHDNDGSRHHPGTVQPGTAAAAAMAKKLGLRGGITTASSTPTTPFAASSSGIGRSGAGGVSADAMIGTDNGGELLTELSDLDSRCTNTKMVTFDQFVSGFVNAGGPLEVGTTSIPSVGESVVVTASSSSSVIGNGLYDLNFNGFWNSGRGGYIGTNSFDTTIDLRFEEAALKCCVGGLVNYSPDVVTQGAIVTMQALDSSGNVLSTFDYEADGAPISTEDALNEGAYRLIFRPACDIRTVRISGAFQVLDDLVFDEKKVTASPTEMPSEPPTEAPTSSPSKSPTEAPTSSPSKLPTATPTRECPLCGNSSVTNIEVSVTTTLLGICKAKCIPADQVDKFETLGYECGLCDDED
jgi:hypothetical protein